MEPEEANKQLLTMNEANMYSLFAKKNIPAMKRLTEGEGRSVESKFKHPFTGFKKSYLFITCNYLCCPLVPPENSKSGWTQYEYQMDNEAFNARISVVKTTKKFKDTGLEFDQDDWAQCLLYMAQNFNLMQKPVVADLFGEQHFGAQDYQSNVNSNRACSIINGIPEAVLLHKINDLNRDKQGMESMMKNMQQEKQILQSRLDFQKEKSIQPSQPASQINNNFINCNIQSTEEVQ